MICFMSWFVLPTGRRELCDSNTCLPSDGYQGVPCQLLVFFCTRWTQVKLCFVFVLFVCYIFICDFDFKMTKYLFIT